MLKGIPKILSPQLLKVLCEMGHADRIVISNGNFPAESVGKNGIVVRLDGHNVPEVLDAVLTVFPLDTYIAGQHKRGEQNKTNKCRTKVNNPFDVAFKFVHSINDISVSKSSHLSVSQYLRVRSNKINDILLFLLCNLS